MAIYASNIYGGSSVSTGDQYRTGTDTSVGSNTTILTLTTTSGVIQGILISWSLTGGVNGQTAVDTLKLTVDGASERTLNGRLSSCREYSGGDSVGVILTQYFPFPEGIRFSDSITIKVTKTTLSGTPADCSATVHYSVN